MSKFQDWKLSAKVTAGLSAMLLAGIAGQIFAFRARAEVAARQQNEIYPLAKVLQLQAEAAEASGRMVLQTRLYISEPTEARKADKLKCDDQTQGKLGEAEKLASALPNSAKLTEAFTVLKDFDEKNLAPLEDEIMGYVDAKKPEKAAEVFSSKYQPKHDEFGALSSKLAEIASAEIKTRFSELDALSAKASLFGWVSLGLLLAVAGFVRQIFAKFVLKPAVQLQSGLDQLESGDLTAKVEPMSSDEMGQMALKFSQSAGALGATISDVNAVSISIQNSFKQNETLINSASGLATEIQVQADQFFHSLEEEKGLLSEMESIAEQVNEAVNQVAMGAESTASSAERSAQGMHLVSESAGRLSDQISTAATKAMSAAKAGNETGEILEDSQASMRRIQTEAASASAEIESFQAMSVQIGEIVSTIQSIAEQTNLLALNAAIEAARAGEQGRGFAVVAEEVRKLAERSAQSAQEIRGIIDQTRERAESAISVIRTATDAIEEGAQLSERAHTSVTGILEAVDSIAATMESSLSEAMNISSAIENARGEIETIAAAAEESSASAEEMAASSHELRQVIRKVATTGQANASVASQMSDATLEQVRMLSEVIAALGETGTAVSDLQRKLAHFKTGSGSGLSVVSYDRAAA
ncbi:MAG: hypothetical protein JST35_12690 [Armatimonadetes bacterium]|nr:hypothetical protein [Armatimonadota bacterium]